MPWSMYESEKRYYLKCETVMRPSSTLNAALPERAQKARIGFSVHTRSARACRLDVVPGDACPIGRCLAPAAAWFKAVAGQPAANFNRQKHFENDRKYFGALAATFISYGARALASSKVCLLSTCSGLGRRPANVVPVVKSRQTRRSSSRTIGTAPGTGILGPERRKGNLVFNEPSSTPCVRRKHQGLT
jgi:hypothetical protein